MDKGITREQVERAARMYKSNQDAGQAMGVHPRSFARLCRRYGIETPYVRRRRRPAPVGTDAAAEEQEHHPWSVRLVEPGG